MKHGPVCLLFCLLLFVTLGSAAAEKPWIEIRSPHFRVLTNGSPADARHVAHEFEQMRYVFASQFPAFRLDSGAPLTIFAARDEQTAKELEPAMWKAKGIKPAGVFHHSWEKQYVMVRLDATGLSPRVEVYHEYTHSILHLNSHWLPTWLDEGMAEFYGYTRFEQHKIYIGAPTVRVNALQGSSIPIEDLMSDDKVRSFYRDQERAEMFYAESWALVHYMIFGPGMDRGAKLNQFFRLIQQETNQKQAFQQVFGDFGAMDKAFNIYMRSFAFHAAVILSPPQIDEKDFTSHPLTMAQTEAELAGFHLWNHDLNVARVLVAKALKDDPKLGQAHEEDGFLLFADGQDAVARDEFAQAYALDGTLYLSLFAKTMLSPMANSNTSADEAAFHAGLSKVADLNSQFAPAYIQLARLELRKNDPRSALGLSRRAEELEPWRAGYHLLTGQILLRMGKDAEAADFAKYVAKHWYGPDHDEAVDLWDSIPAAQRPAGESLTDQLPANTQTAEGIVKSVTCGGTPQGNVFVLEHDGRAQSFQTKGPLMIGMPDTLWYGSDHFSLCHNIEGMHAVIRYRPSSDPGFAGDLAEIEIRDPVPAVSAATEVQLAK